MSEGLSCQGCGQDMSSTTTDKRTWDLCEHCGSAFIKQRDLIPILTAISQAAHGEVDFDKELTRVPKSVPPACPACERTTEVFGYMGTNVVYPARCRRCEAIWIGPDALEAMVLLFGRTQTRRLHGEAELERQKREMDHVLQAVLKGRTRGNRFGNLLH